MPDYPSKDGAVRKPSELKEGQPLQVVFHGNNGIDDKGVHTVTGKALTTYEDSVYGYRPHRIWTVRDESGKNHLLADKDDMSFHQSVLSIVEIPIKELIDVQNECGRCPTCGIRKVRQPDDIQSGHVEYETETLCGNSTCSDECWESWTFCPYCGKPFEGKGK